MQVLIDLIERTKGYKDPVRYHPEPSLYHHVAIVTARAHYMIGDRSVVMAGLLHDLMKPVDALYHASLMANYFMDNDDLRYFVKCYDGDINIVHDIIKYHMAKAVSKNSKHIPFIDKFFCIDDMIGRYELPTRVTNIILPNGETFNNVNISFIGQSPVQIHSQKEDKMFTITINRTPFTFDIKYVDFFLKTII